MILFKSEHGNRKIASLEPVPSSLEHLWDQFLLYFSAASLEPFLD
jgi:hypothetical protein